MARRVRSSARRHEGGGVRLVPGLVRAGQILAGRYRVEELLGSGASGVVLAAINIHLRQRVTLKLLASYTHSQEEQLERRLAKARLASRLRGSHVARIVDIGVTEDEMPYIATELLEGNTLAVELARGERVDVAEAARWMLEACEALAEAHAAGLVHGDLKPQNVFLADPASPDVHRSIKLLDFGTTSPLDAIGDQSTSAFFGSPAFLAPEQIQAPGSVDARADIWAVGVMLYQLIAGALPFEADSVSGVIVAVVHDTPALLTGAPYELARLVSRCLDKDPTRRPADVTELAKALAPFAGREGARLSERVRAMLAAPPSPAPDVQAEDATFGSVSPVALTLDAPEVHPRGEATRPSRRVLEHRRREQATRGRRLGLLAATAFVLAAVASRTSGLLPPPSSASKPELEPAGPPPNDTVVVPPYVPRIEPITVTTPAELRDVVAPPPSAPRPWPPRPVPAPRQAPAPRPVKATSAAPQPGLFTERR